jgi:hypothetical protein
VNVDVLYEVYARVARVINDSSMRLDLALDAPPNETPALAFFFRVGGAVPVMNTWCSFAVLFSCIQPNQPIEPGVLMKFIGRMKTGDFFQVFSILQVDDPAEELACAQLRSQLPSRNKEI